MIQQHRFALFYSVFVGLCMFLSYGVAIWQLGDDYRGIVPMYYDDGNVYRARIQDVLDGHPMVVSPFIHEYKNEPANVAPIGEWLYALPASVFGTSAVQWVYFFLLPAALFLLVYFLVRRLLNEETRDAELTAITAGAVVLFGFEFVDYHYVLSLLQGGSPSALIWTRPVNPVIGALQLFSLLLMLWKLIQGERRYIHFVGILVATMVGYYFAWGMALAILGALFLVYCARKDFAVARDIFYSGTLSIVLVSPYVYSSLSGFGGEDGVRVSMRTGMFYTHEFVVNTVLLLTTLIVIGCFAYAYRKDTWRVNERSWIFIVALLIAAWVAFNEQVITGRQIWHHHFVQYTVPFSYIAILVSGYLSLRSLAPRLWRVAVGIVIALMCIHGIYSALALYKAEIDDFRKQQEYAELVTWFSQNGGETCVIISLEDEIGKIINGYSHCDAYVSGAAFLAVPAERVLHNYFLSLRLRGVQAESVEEHFLSNESEVRYTMFDDWHQLYGHGKDEWFYNKVAYLTPLYKAFWEKSLTEQLHTYRADFFVTRELLRADIVQQLPGLGTPQKVGEFYLYEFK